MKKFSSPFLTNQHRISRHQTLSFLLKSHNFLFPFFSFTFSHHNSYFVYFRKFKSSALLVYFFSFYCLSHTLLVLVVRVVRGIGISGILSIFVRWRSLWQSRFFRRTSLLSENQLIIEDPVRSEKSLSEWSEGSIPERTNGVSKYGLKTLVLCSVVFLC